MQSSKKIEFFLRRSLSPWSFAFCSSFRYESSLFKLLVDLEFNCIPFFLGGRTSFHLSHLGFVFSVFVVCAEEEVEVAEGGAEVVDECHVVEVVVVGTRPEWKDVLERPWEIYLLLGEFVSETCYPNYVTMDRDTYHNLSEHRWPGKDGE